MIDFPDGSDIDQELPECKDSERSVRFVTRVRCQLTTPEIMLE